MTTYYILVNFPNNSNPFKILLSISSLFQVIKEGTTPLFVTNVLTPGEAFKIWEEEKVDAGENRRGKEEAPSSQCEEKKTLKARDFQAIKFQNKLQSKLQRQKDLMAKVTQFPRQKAPSFPDKFTRVK